MYYHTCIIVLVVGCPYAHLTHGIVSIVLRVRHPARFAAHLPGTMAARSLFEEMVPTKPSHRGAILSNIRRNGSTPLCMLQFAEVRKHIVWHLFVHSPGIMWLNRNTCMIGVRSQGEISEI